MTFFSSLVAAWPLRFLVSFFGRLPGKHLGSLKFLMPTLFIATAFLATGCVDADRSKRGFGDFNGAGQGWGDGYVSGQGRVGFNESLSAYNRASFLLANDIAVTHFKLENEGEGFFAESNRFTLRLQVCKIRDRVKNENLEGQIFKIRSEFSEQVVEVANDCLTWVESIGYNMFAPSQHLILHFQIKAIEGSVGEIVRRLSLNPWDKKIQANDYSGVMDITNLNRKDWPNGRSIVGQKDILLALKGDLIDDKSFQPRLIANGLKIYPRMKEGVTAWELNAEQGLSSKNKERMKKLRDFQAQQMGLRMSWHVGFQPQIERRDSTGLKDFDDLTSGRYKVYMQILSTGLDGSGKWRILSHVNPPENVTLSSRKSGENQNGEPSVPIFDGAEAGAFGVQTQVDMNLGLWASEGNIALAVKVVPVDLPNNVLPFSAFYDLGPASNLMSAQVLVLKKDAFRVYDQPHDYDEKLREASNFHDHAKGLGLDNNEIYNNIATLKKAELYQFSLLDIRFVRILPGETATERSFQYASKSCISHSLTGARVGPGLQFEVVTEDRGVKMTMQRETDEDGCLTWFGILSHKYYHKEVLVEKIAQVRYLGSQRKPSKELPRNPLLRATELERRAQARDQQAKQLVNGFEKKFTYYMNPWDEKFTFGWDERNTPDNYVKDINEQKQEAPTSRLFMADFRYETMGFRYEIDRFMRLRVKKSILFKTFPMVLKYNSIVRGRSGTEPLRDGVYLMKFAMQKDYLDPAGRVMCFYSDPDNQGARGYALPNGTNCGESPGQGLPFVPDDEKQYISTQQKLVRVLGGRIITPVEFTMEDLRLMRIRNQMFIQLQTIDENRLRLASLLNDKLDKLMVPHHECGFGVSFDYDTTEKEMADEIDKCYFQKLLEDTVAKTRLQSQENGRTFEEELLHVLSTVKSAFDTKEGSLLEARDRLKKYMAFADLCRTEGAEPENCYRNHKYNSINRLMAKLFERSEESSSKAVAKMTSQAHSENQIIDSMDKYFYVTLSDSPDDLVALFDGDKKALEEMKYVDFTVSPLAPNFSFELLANDGDALENLEESGLPSRTFVGPLTFLLNTNGSALRPTDILSEGYCLSASCSVADVINDGQPLGPVMHSAATDDQGDFLPDSLLELGDPINAAYEQDKFYGYLKEYLGKSVDDLIKAEKEIDREENKKYTYQSNLEIFLNTHGLDYVSLNPVACEPGTPAYDLDLCYLDQSFHHRSKGQSLEAIENPSTYGHDVKESGKIRKGVSRAWNKISEFGSNFPGKDFDNGGDVEEAKDDGMTVQSFNSEEFEVLIREGWKAPESVISTEKKVFYFRKFCRILSEKIFAVNSEKMEALNEGISEERAKVQPIHFQEAASHLEGKCKRWTSQLFDKIDDVGLDRDPQDDVLVTRADIEMSPPIIFERKMRVYDTTKEYFYRGGKSLNINVGNSFSLSHNNGYTTGISTNWSPWDYPKAIAEKVAKFWPALGIFKTIVNSYSLQVNWRKTQNQNSQNGINVSAGTYLVSQEGTFDIQVGKAERCMVVRPDEALMIDLLNDKNKLAKSLGREIDYTHLMSSQGFMFCTGKVEEECQPIREKYYFFTQHFTQGDLLDIADLSNHPWLLQLRGYRDYQVFTKSIGSMRSSFIDDRTRSVFFREMMNDAANFRKLFDGDTFEQRLKVVDQEADIDWSLRDLGRAYFNVLPTFPGLYTFSEEPEERYDPKDWPNSSSQPGGFETCRGRPFQPKINADGVHP